VKFVTGLDQVVFDFIGVLIIKFLKVDIHCKEQFGPTYSGIVTVRRISLVF
jgi:hypothetical protein